MFGRHGFPLGAPHRNRTGGRFAVLTARRTAFAKWPSRTTNKQKCSRPTSQLRQTKTTQKPVQITERSKNKSVSTSRFTTREKHCFPKNNESKWENERSTNWRHVSEKRMMANPSLGYGVNKTQICLPPGPWNSTITWKT